MRFLARFASAADLECFRIDELRAVCALLGVKQWHIEGISSHGDANNAATNNVCRGKGDQDGCVKEAPLLGAIGDEDPALLVDALILDESIAASSRALAKQLTADQPLGNHKNFYCTASPVGDNSDEANDAALNVRQPLNFAIIHLESIEEAVAVAQRCVMLKGLSLLFATSTTIEGLIANVQQLIVKETSETENDNEVVMVKEVFVNPSDNVAAKKEDAQKKEKKRVELSIVKDGSSSSALLSSLMGSNINFKYCVESVCYNVGGPEKLAIINQFAALPHKGEVKLADPDLIFEVNMLFKHLPINPRVDKSVPPLLGVAFSVPVAISGRTFILERYALNRRPYIGTTSMPPEYTFLMANLAKVAKGDVCYDPFCGTCSSLVTCAHHGAIAYGSDIDGQAMRGGSAKFRASKQVLQQQKHALKHYLPQCLKENGGPLSAEEVAHPTVYTNFKVFGLPPPERLRYDFSLWVTLFDQLDSAIVAKKKAAELAAVAAGASDDAPSSSLIAVGVKRPRNVTKPFLFDAILSDPPYGVREQKLATTTAADEGTAAVSTSTNAILPNTEDYDISTMIVDLIRFAGVHLAVGKRIVFWHPTTYHYTHEELPRHPFLKIILARPQMLSLKFVRVLVVMERVAEPWFALPKGVRGPQDVTKSVLFPNQKTQSLRDLMHTTELADNEAYSQYKNKIKEKREAIRSYWREQKDGGGEGEEDATAAVAVHGKSHTAKQAIVGNSDTNADGAGAVLSKRQQSKLKALTNLENRKKKLETEEKQSTKE